MCGVVGVEWLVVGGVGGLGGVEGEGGGFGVLVESDGE